MSIHFSSRIWSSDPQISAWSTTQIFKTGQWVGCAAFNSLSTSAELLFFKLLLQLLNCPPQHYKFWGLILILFNSFFLLAGWKIIATSQQYSTNGRHQPWWYHGCVTSCRMLWVAGSQGWHGRFLGILLGLFKENILGHFLLNKDCISLNFLGKESPQTFPGRPAPWVQWLTFQYPSPQFQLSFWSQLSIWMEKLCYW